MSSRESTAAQILLEAVEHDPGARPAFVQEACAGDPILLNRVEALLRAHGQANPLLDGERLVATIEQPPPEQLGTQIGPYKLRELLGEGGMGSVYVAEQQVPVRRKVALKVIKPGMDSRQVLGRFEAERHTLALMDHPHIAKVLDAGTTDSGRPYFVMELVRGVPITEFCDQRRLETRQRLELFIQVCRAIQHAHQKGIIHRDIKPSNILVTLHDDLAVPKVIDFGIAKATTQQLTEQTVYTAFNQMIGTPVYMSPEQAEMNALDVDTRSDVYSLGVLLYELLTGSTPFDNDTFRQAGFDEMRRLIREVDPPRPSQRVSTLGAQAASTVSKSRGIDERRLNHVLRGDLDWIVMKAIEKDRNRRYESSSALADDVQRHLNDEPVEACPPSALYRFKKLARRHRVALATTTLVSLALIAGTVVSVWQAVRATRAEERAEMRSQQAHRAVDEMYTGVAEKWLGQQPELTEVQRDFLQKALAFYEQFAAETGDEPLARLDVAVARLRAGRIQQRLGAFTQAEASISKSITQLKELRANAPDRNAYVVELGDAIGALASVNLELGRTDEAERLMKQVVAIFEESVVRHPENLKLQGELAAALRMLGSTTYRRDPGPAEKYLIRGRDLSQELVAKGHETATFRLEVARGEKALADLFLDGKRLPESEQAIQRAIDQFEDLLSGDPADRDYRGLLADSVSDQAVVLDGLGRKDEALEAFRRAAAIREGLATEFPTRANRGALLTALFNLIQALPDPQEIAQVGRQGLALGEGLVHDFPAVPDYQQCLTVFLLATGHSLRTTQPEQARSHWERAYALGEKLLADFPDEPHYSVIVAVTSAYSATNYAAGPPDDPLYDPPLALKRAQRAVELMPEDIENQSALGCAQYRTGDLDGCIVTIERIDASNANDRSDDFYLAMAYARLGKKNLAVAKFHRAEEWLHERTLKGEWDTHKYPDEPTARRIRDEAAALLGLPPSSVPSTAPTAAEIRNQENKKPGR